MPPPKRPYRIYGWHCYVCDEIVLTRSLEHTRHEGQMHMALDHRELYQPIPFETAWDERLSDRLVLWLAPGDARP